MAGDEHPALPHAPSLPLSPHLWVSVDELMTRGEDQAEEARGEGGAGVAVKQVHVQALHQGHLGGDRPKGGNKGGKKVLGGVTGGADVA